MTEHETTLGEVLNTLAGLRDENLELLGGGMPDSAPVRVGSQVDDDGTYYLWVERVR